MKIVLLVIFVITSSILFSSESAYDVTMLEIVKSYQNIHVMLADDQIEGLEDEIEVIKTKVEKLVIKTVPADKVKNYSEIKVKIETAIVDLEKAKNIAEVRSGFAQLSKPLVLWVTMNKPAGENVAFCSMSNSSWIQVGDDIKNPYYGKSMLKCGEFIQKGDKPTELDTTDSSKHID